MRIDLFPVKICVIRLLSHPINTASKILLRNNLKNDEFINKPVQPYQY